MQIFITGEKFPCDVAEGLSAYFDGSRIHLVVGYDNIKESEFEGFMNEEIEFYLSYVNNVFFLCLKIKSFIDLSDVALFIDIQDKDLDLIKKGDMSYPVYMFLVDTSDNTFMGARVLGLSNEMSHNMSLVLKGMNGHYPNMQQYRKNAKYVMSKLKTEEIKNLSFSEYKSKPIVF